MALGIPNFSFKKENPKLSEDDITSLKTEHAALLSELMHIGSEELNSGKSQFNERQKKQVRMEEIERELAKNDVFIGHDAEAA